MTIVLVGDATDSRGFSLAGVTTHVPETDKELRDVLDHCCRARSVGLVLLSRSAAQRVPDLIRARAHVVEPPAFLVLPGPVPEPTPGRSMESAP